MHAAQWHRRPQTKVLRRRSLLLFRGERAAVSAQGGRRTGFTTARGTKSSESLGGSKPPFSPIHLACLAPGGEASSPPQPITAGPHDFGPVWGPTGIAFTRWLAAGKPGDIWLVQPNGDGPRRLTRTDAGIQPFAFSADGLSLIAQNPASHNGRIWAVDVSTGSARDLTGWVGDLFPQGVSRDGTSILVGIGWGGSPAQPARSRSSPPRVDRPAQSHAAPAGPAGTPEAFPQPEWARRARARVTGHGVMTLGGLGPESLTRRMGLRSRNASR